MYTSSIDVDEPDLRQVHSVHFPIVVFGPRWHGRVPFKQSVGGERQLFLFGHQGKLAAEHHSRTAGIFRINLIHCTATQLCKLNATTGLALMSCIEASMSES